MKTLLFMLMPVVTSTLLMGICDGPENDPNKPIANEIRDFSQSVGYDIFCDANICGHAYIADFYAEEPGWYWLGIEEEGWGIHIAGHGRKITEVPANVVCTLFYRHFDYENPGEDLPVLYAFCSQDYSGIGNFSDYKARGGGSSVTLSIVNTENCPTACCSFEGNKNWVFAAKELNSVIGIEADIETKIGKHCGYAVSSTDSSFSAAWIGINEKLFEPGAFVQFGYMNYRFPQESENLSYYFEIREPGSDTTHLLFWDFMTLQENSTHNYRFEVDYTADEISFYVDDQPGYMFPEVSAWNSSTGQHAIWSGEILCWETDMPGTESDSCEFSNCKVQRDGSSWISAAFDSPPDVISSIDASEWMIEYSSGASSFRIWDVHPLE